MGNRLQGWGLEVLSRIAGADWPDRLGLRRPMEKALYQGSRQGFHWASAAAKRFTSRQGPRNRLNTASASGLFDLSLSDEQQQMCDSLGRFAREWLYPQAHDADAQAALPADLLAASQELGLALYAVSEAHGGMATENSTVTQTLIAETLAQGDYSLAVALLSTISVANAITRWGSGPQQASYLPAFLDDNKPLRACMAVMEPEALFNPMHLATTAVRQGQGYVLNGHKSMVLGAAEADLMLVAAHTESGPAVFIVECQQQGLGWREAPAMGLRAAATADVVLDHVHVNLEAKLGDADFDYSTFLDYGSLGWCAMATGCCQAVLDYVIPYCNEREAFGEPISHRQGVAFMIANMAVELESMRIMTWRAAARAEQGLDFHREAYLARLLCTEKAMQIGTDGVQLLGGHGFTKEHPVERWYRDLRATGLMWGGLHL